MVPHVSISCFVSYHFVDQGRVLIPFFIKKKKKQHKKFIIANNSINTESDQKEGIKAVSQPQILSKKGKHIYVDYVAAMPINPECR